MNINKTQGYTRRARTVIAALSSGALMVAGLTVVGVQAASAAPNPSLGPALMGGIVDKDGDGVDDGKDKCIADPEFSSVDD